jgi:hypothetical protein
MTDIVKQKDELAKEKLDPTIEEKVADRLALVPGMLDEEQTDTDEEPEVDEKEQETTKELEQETVDEGTGLEKKSDKVVLPENFRRAAIHQGWSEDEVSEFFKDNPDRALKTFGKIYDSTNFISEQTAALGRLVTKQNQEKLEQENRPVKPKFKDAIEGLRKKYGEEDPALVDILDVITSQNEQLYETISGLKGQGQPKVSEEDTRMWRTINGFFNGPDIAAYKLFYGESKGSDNWHQELTGEQVQNRMKVLEKTDQIVAGTQFQGKKIEYEDALLQAHLVVSDKVRETGVRTDLINKVKERNRGLTVKGTQKAVVEQISAKRSEDKALETAKRGLKKLFGMSD